MDDYEKFCRDFGIPTFEERPRPRAVITALKKAVDAGEHELVQRSLQEQVLINKLYNNKRSFAAVRSGIKAWHEFAVEVLTYSRRCTLPPKASRHVQMFQSI